MSIARRLQDPLAELVKIDPKAIGVGQYQHDVDQRDLLKKLDAVVEDCVNAVGVDVNTASSALLARVCRDLNSVLARQIVDYRDANGRFKGRDALLAVPRVGAKTYQQAAGFLRIADGDNPLDRSAVHPEAYPLVERILKQIGKPARRSDGAGWRVAEPRCQEFRGSKLRRTDGTRCVCRAGKARSRSRAVNSARRALTMR